MPRWKGPGDTKEQNQKRRGAAFNALRLERNAEAKDKAEERLAMGGSVEPQGYIEPLPGPYAYTASDYGLEGGVTDAARVPSAGYEEIEMGVGGPDITGMDDAERDAATAQEIQRIENEGHESEHYSDGSEEEKDAAARYENRSRQLGQTVMTHKKNRHGSGVSDDWTKLMVGTGTSKDTRNQEDSKGKGKDESGGKGKGGKGKSKSRFGVSSSQRQRRSDRRKAEEEGAMDDGGGWKTVPSRRNDTRDPESSSGLYPSGDSYGVTGNDLGRD